MDLSKLPRLSGDHKEKDQATPQPEASSKPPAQRPSEYYGPPAGRAEVGAGPEIWLSLVVGGILMFLGWEFARWAFATLSGKTYDTGVVWRTTEKNGQMVPYWQIVGHQALSESAIFLFGLAMVLEGIAMATAMLLPRYWRGMYFVSFLVSILMTLYNIIAVVVLLGDNVMPLYSMLAVGFGGYMAIAQWTALRRAAAAQDNI